VAEATRAVDVGMRRRLSSQYRDSPNKDGLEGEDIAKQVFTHWIGAQGELAFAKWAGLDWPGTVDVGSAPDIEPNWQIRTSRYLDVSLIVTPRDKSHERFVLVLADVSKRVTVFQIVGWVYGWEGKKFPKEPWNRNRSSLIHRVPRSRLHTSFDVPSQAFAGYVL
jgi:hypothetical protein